MLIWSAWSVATRYGSRLGYAAEAAFKDVAPVRDIPLCRVPRHFPGLYWSATR
ncbi:hypothetical protein T261_7837 [Streptomyces lydicus]|nr:hypothetical protein T261_7837 [Streptomyces lydicus]